MILGTAPIEGRISSIVDIPNACCTLWLPTEIFEFDIRPRRTGRNASSPGAVSRRRNVDVH